MQLASFPAPAARSVKIPPRIWCGWKCRNSRICCALMSALFAHLEVHAMRESGANLRRYQQPCFHQSYINSTCAGGARAQRIGCLRASGPSSAAAPSRPGPVLCSHRNVAAKKTTWITDGGAGEMYGLALVDYVFASNMVFVNEWNTASVPRELENFIHTRQTLKRLNLNKMFFLVFLSLFYVIFTSTRANNWTVFFVNLVEIVYIVLLNCFQR